MGIEYACDIVGNENLGLIFYEINFTQMNIRVFLNSLIIIKIN